MNKQQFPYGRRAGLKVADQGIRKVAPTYGKVALTTYAHKANGIIAVEGSAERLVSQAMSVDPTVITINPQPFTIDLIDGQILRTAEDRKLARQKHAHWTGQITYTPDMLLGRSDKTRCAIEIKTQGFEGNQKYDEMLRNAQRILLRHGYGFKRIVVPGNWNHPSWFNIPLLHQAKLRADLTPSDELLDRINEIARPGQVTLARACQLLNISPGLFPVLLVNGVFAMDTSRYLLRGDALLEVAYGSLEHLKFLDRWSL